jgi:hypothetical protein
MARWAPALLAASAATLSGAAAAGNAPTLAISTTGDIRGSGDTVVVAVSSPSSRVDIDVPEGFGFPRPPIVGGHAFIQFADGSGEARTEVRPIEGAPAAACVAGSHEQVWAAEFLHARVFVFLTGRRMTICPLPERTTRITVASKFWSTPTAAGDYTWTATTADGATATATVRLPVRLTLTRTKRGAKTHLRAQMTANGAPFRAKAIHLLAGGRLVATRRTRSDGTTTFVIQINRRTIVYAQAAIGEEADEPHSVRSNRLTLTR